MVERLGSTIGGAVDAFFSEHTNTGRLQGTSTYITIGSDWRCNGADFILAEYKQLKLPEYGSG